MQTRKNRYALLSFVVFIIAFMTVQAYAAPAPPAPRQQPLQIKTLPKSLTLKATAISEDQKLFRTVEGTLFDGCPLTSASKNRDGKLKTQDTDPPYTCPPDHPNYNIGSVSQKELQRTQGVTWIIGAGSQCPDAIYMYSHNIVNVPDGLTVTVSPATFTIPGNGMAYYDLTLKIAAPNMPNDPVFPPGQYQFRIDWTSVHGVSRCTFTVEVTESVTPPILGEIDVLERGRGAGDAYNPDTDRGLIAGINEGYPGYVGYYFYFDDNGNAYPVTEDDLNLVNASTFSKSGLTADGNTRLIVRVWSPDPCSIYLGMKTGMEGFRLESIYGHPLADTQNDYMGFEAFPVAAGGYQASFVLIPPDDLAGEILRRFYFEVVQIDANGEEVGRGTRVLTLKPNPIVMIHGIWGGAGTFGAEADLYTNLKYLRYTFKVLEHTYDGRKGPSESMGPTETALVNTINMAINEMNSMGIACTQADILAHSMGGLYTRKFLIDNIPRYNSRSGYLNGLVRRVITAGTPHNGSQWVHYILGDYSSLNFGAYVITDVPLLNFTATERLLILREIQRAALSDDSNPDYPQYFGRLTWGNNADTDTFTNFVSAIYDMEPGGTFLTALNSYNTTVPMYGLSGNVYPGLRQLMLDPLPGFGGEIGDYNINSGIVGLLGDLGMWLMATPLPYRTIYEHVPPDALVHETMDLVEAILSDANNNDLLVKNASSIWRYPNTKNYVYTHHEPGLSRIMSSHTEFTKLQALGDKVQELLLGPRSAFMLPGEVIVASVPESPLSTQKSPVSRTRMNTYERLTSEELVTPDRVQAIQIEAPGEIFYGDSLLVTGHVTREFKDDRVRISVYSLNNPGKILGLQSVEVDKEGKFKTEMLLRPATGKVLIKADAGDLSGTKGPNYFSNVLDNVLVKPKITHLWSINFEDTYLGVDVGNTRKLDLTAKDGDRFWDISLPAYGTIFRLEDPSVASITEEGYIRGLRAGDTVLHASFGNYRAAAQVAVRNPLPVSPVATKTDFSRSIQRSSSDPENPLILEPSAGAAFKKGKEITFRVTPFDTSRGQILVGSYWDIRLADNQDVRVARLSDGTDSYANWLPEKAGRYVWSMYYVYRNLDGTGRRLTEPTPWTPFTVEE